MLPGKKSKVDVILVKLGLCLVTVMTLILLFFPGSTVVIYGPKGEKNCLRGFANNKGTDQPAHMRSLISAFVIPFLESIISRLASSEILIF